MKGQEFPNFVTKPTLTHKSIDKTSNTEIENRIINSEDETIMDEKIELIKEIIASNDGKALDDTGRDELYDSAVKVWTELAVYLKETTFQLYFNRKEFSFLTDVLCVKNEYGVDTVFEAIQLTDMLASWSKQDGRFKNNDDNQFFGFGVTATELTIIYHLISTHKTKGMNSSTYTFAKVLERIGSVSKIIKYYDTATKSSKDAISVWATNMESEDEKQDAIQEPESAQ